MRVSPKNISPKERLMHDAHKLAKQKICKLSKKLKNKDDQLKVLKRAYAKGRLDDIKSKLNNVTQNFIKSQLRNAEKTPYRKE